MPIDDEHDSSIIAALNQLRQSADLEGLAVLDLSQPDMPVSHSVGLSGVETLDFGCALLAANPQGPAHGIAGDQRRVLACPWVLPPARPGGLLLWRDPRARLWADMDHGLAASVAALVLVAVTAGAGQIGIDRLTGVPNRRWFLDEADRRIDRLDLDGVIGTLCLIDVDDLHRLNANLGRQEGDRVLIRMASQLRSIVRPSDLVARVGADEFAVWQDGMDHLTAAERADALCTERMFIDVPKEQRATFSIGIASRRPGSAEDIRTLLRRAHMAARDVKAQGGGGWRVSHAEPARRGIDPPE